MQELIEIKNLSKKYGNKVVLEDIGLNIRKGEFISIIGPNGCGKTTLLRIIAGLEHASSGSVTKDTNNLSFVFQDCRESLLPWRNVYENISLPLELSGAKNYRKTVLGIAKELKLENHLGKYPYQLSGGLTQLTAIARGLATDPVVLMLDEPFRSLDFDISRHILRLIIDYCEKKGITSILISHDIDSAVLFADRVAVFSGTPSRIKRIVPVKIKRPRMLEHMRMQEFFTIKKTLLKEFENEG